MGEIKIGGAALYALGMGIFAVPALAQTDAGQNVSALDDIIVTAQKRSERLQSVPIAVTAIAGGDLVATNVMGPASLPRVTPNLVVTVNSTFATPYIRGIGSQYANAGLENSVSIYLDDTYVPRSTAGYFEFADIERVEVLKGPQGTLYGRNATGGAIRIITMDPKLDTFEGFAIGTYGSQERIVGEGMLNIPLGEKVALRVNARHAQDDGFMKNLNPLGVQRYDHNQDIYRAKLLLEPNDNLRIKVSGDYLEETGAATEANKNLYPSLPEQIGAPGGVAGDFYTVNNDYADAGLYNEAWGIAVRAELSLGDSTISSITAWRSEKQDAGVDLDSTGSPLQNASQQSKTNQFTQEFQLAYDGPGKIKYVGGVFYLQETARTAFGVWGTSTGGAYLGGSGQVRTQSIAPYLQADYKFSDKFAATVGLRYTYERKRLDYNLGTVGTPPAAGSRVPTDVVFAPGGPCVTPGQIMCEAPRVFPEFTQFTPKLTLSYTPSRRLLFYVTASRGFKSGGINLPTFGAADVVRPEILNAFEIGWKTEFANLRFNGSAFYYDYKDLQVAISDQTTGGSRTVNAANAEIYGIETEITWAPIRTLEFGAGGGYLHGTYKDYRGDANVPCTQIPTNAGCIAQGGLGLGVIAGSDFSGNQLIGSPRWNGFLRGRYSIPLGDIGSIALSGIVNYRSKVVFDPAGLFPQKGYALVSARIGWTSADDRFSLAVFGDNLTGQKYYTFRNPNNVGGWQYAGPKRAVFVQAGVKF